MNTKKLFAFLCDGRGRCKGTSSDDEGKDELAAVGVVHVVDDDGVEEACRPYSLPSQSKGILEEIPRCGCGEPRDFQWPSFGQRPPLSSACFTAREVCYTSNKSFRPRAESILETRCQKSVSPAFSRNTRATFSIPTSISGATCSRSSYNR